MNKLLQHTSAQQRAWLPRQAHKHKETRESGRKADTESKVVVLKAMLNALNGATRSLDSLGSVHTAQVLETVGVVF